MGYTNVWFRISNFSPRCSVIIILDLSGVYKTSKPAVVLIVGVTISGTPCTLHITVPFSAEAPSGHVQSHLHLEACFPDSTENRRQRQGQTECPPPEPSKPLVIAKLNSEHGIKTCETDVFIAGVTISGACLYILFISF